MNSIKSGMEPSENRDKIDQIVLENIVDVLVSYGVHPDMAYACYDKFRFQAEARAVLLNRVSDRNATGGSEYYGPYLDGVAASAGVEYVRS